MASPLPQGPSSSTANMESYPLFMRNLPEGDSENVALEALRSLVYEGTPDEQARNFKEQGNEYFRGNRHREALNFYTQGLNVQPNDPGIREALLLNRAACNLKLSETGFIRTRYAELISIYPSENYGSVLRDTSEAILLNPKATKGYFRASAALVELERYDEALDVCDRCLVFDPNDNTVRQQKEKAVIAKQAWDRKEMDKADRARKEIAEKRVMNAAFKALHLVVIPWTREPDYLPHFDPTFSGLRTFTTPVLFPVHLLYPQYNTSDLITSFDPSATFASHLATMFPPTPGAPVTPPAYNVQPPTHGPEWDTRQQYTTSNLAVYATTSRRRLLKIGKRMTLRDACDSAAAVPAGSERDGLELREGCLVFFVMPKGDSENTWVEEYKQKRASDGF